MSFLKDNNDLARNHGMEAYITEQALSDLRNARGLARINELQVHECGFPGAPENAAQALHLSPEANIPLMLNDSGLCLNLAPSLTIKNKWENAFIPHFTSMEPDLIIPLGKFTKAEPFRSDFILENQIKPIRTTIDFTPKQPTE